MYYSSFKLVQANRLKQVSDQLNTLNSLCSVLGLDVKDKICDIFPTMVNSSLRKDVSDNTIKNLTSEIQSLREIKIHRMQKVITLVLVLYPSNTDLFLVPFLTLHAASASKSCSISIRDVGFNGYTAGGTAEISPCYQ